jgi:hypothetical protein
MGEFENRVTGEFLSNLRAESLELTSRPFRTGEGAGD